MKNDNSNKILKINNTSENVNRILIKFLNVHTSQDTFKIIVNEAINIFKADSGSLFLEQDNILERVYSSQQDLKNIKVRKNGNAFKAFKERKISIVNVDTIEKIHPGLKKLGIKSMLMVPLSFKNKALGVITLNYLSKTRLTDRKIENLKLFSSLSSLKLVNVQLFSETENALETRDLFFSVAAHELRTPLTSINGYIQLLYSRMSEGENSESRWVRELYMESKKMTNLVMKLLEISRIQRGTAQFEFKECKMNNVVEKVIDNFNVLYPHRKIIFINTLKDEEDKIIGDFEKITQVLNNILENSIKFSSSEKEVIIELLSKDNYMRLRVIDEGMGIEKRNIQKIFKGQYKQFKREYNEGMGLGLYLAKKIVDKHHGNINIKSRLKKGTIVEVSFPKASI